MNQENSSSCVFPHSTVTLALPTISGKWFKSCTGPQGWGGGRGCYVYFIKICFLCFRRDFFFFMFSHWTTGCESRVCQYSVCQMKTHDILPACTPLKSTFLWCKLGYYMFRAGKVAENESAQSNSCFSSALNLRKRAEPSRTET